MNQARAREGAITQYMAQQELEDKDFGKLASKLKETAIVEMKHAEKWRKGSSSEGEPTSKPDGVAKKGQEISEMLKTDIGLESEAIRCTMKCRSLRG